MAEARTKPPRMQQYYAKRASVYEESRSRQA